jgi:hypothetical protein
MHGGSSLIVVSVSGATSCHDTPAASRSPATGRAVAGHRTRNYRPAGGNHPSDASGVTFGAACYSKARVHGDPDAQVDDRLLEWPATNGVRVGIYLRHGLA